jgi:uncharacterized protein DUF6941
MPRSAIAIFCDDIRTESTGKRIVIGMYEGVLVVPGIPFDIPQLNALIIVRTPADDPIERLSIGVEVPGRMPQVRPAQIQSVPKGAPGTLITFEFLLNLGPLTVDTPSLVKVYVTTEREEFLAGTLQIHRAETASSESPSQQLG